MEICSWPWVLLSFTNIFRMHPVLLLYTCKAKKLPKVHCQFFLFSQQVVYCHLLYFCQLCSHIQLSFQSLHILSNLWNIYMKVILTWPFYILLAFRKNLLGFRVLWNVKKHVTEVWPGSYSAGGEDTEYASRECSVLVVVDAFVGWRRGKCQLTWSRNLSGWWGMGGLKSRYDQRQQKGMKERSQKWKGELGGTDQKGGQGEGKSPVWTNSWACQWWTVGVIIYTVYIRIQKQVALGQDHQMWWRVPCSLQPQKRRVMRWEQV